MSFAKIRPGLAALGLVALLLGAGCGNKEEATSTNAPSGSDPRSSAMQRLKDPSVSEAEKEQIRRSLGMSTGGGTGGATGGQTGGTTSAPPGSTGAPATGGGGR
jgi:hypothetical protein